MNFNKQHCNSRNATYYSAKIAYSQLQYAISSITQKYTVQIKLLQETPARNLLVTIVSLRCCATNFSQTSLLLMETLSSCIEMAESFGVHCVVKQSMDSPKRRKRSSRLYATHGRQKGFQYFRRFCFKYGAHVWEFLGLFYQSILDHKSGVNFHLLRCALAPLFNPSWCSQ